ncbi:hypothetical protein D9M73_153160 [compost metagenome]
MGADRVHLHCSSVGRGDVSNIPEPGRPTLGGIKTADVGCGGRVANDIAGFTRRGTGHATDPARSRLIAVLQVHQVGAA